MDFNFLKEIKLVNYTPAEKGKTSKNPTGLALRIYANGKAYPSLDLVKEFNLEYGENTYGLDIFDAHSWGLYPKDQPNVMFVTPVKRSEPKIDLFGTRRSEETSVVDQGPNADWVIEMASRVVGHPLDGIEYIDLVLDTTVPVVTPDNIYYIPKTVARGEKKGTVTVVRRENLHLFPAEVIVKLTEAVEEEITTNN